MTAHHKLLLLVTLFAAIILNSCGVGGSGGDVPPIPSDFQVGASIPGWTLRQATGGRADPQALASHDGSQWSILLKRDLAHHPKDICFALAISDNGLSHSGVPCVRFTADPNATTGPGTLRAQRVQNGQITLDGVQSPGEWDPSQPTSLDAVPQNDFPNGVWPSAVAISVDATAAYDEEYIYFAFQWLDPSGTLSDKGPMLQWDGSSWAQRPHRSNDTNGNGILEAGETLNVSSPREGEDRLMLFFPIEDKSNVYRPGSVGCADSCHTNSAFDASGTLATHATTLPGDLLDVWSWGAAQSGAGLRARDALLEYREDTGGGPIPSGLVFDQGRPASVAQNPNSPSVMFAAPTTGFQPLIDEPLMFSAEPGYPSLPGVQANAATMDFSNFNMSGAEPQAWTEATQFVNNFLPAFVHQSSNGSQADLEMVGNYDNGTWTVEIRRRRLARSASGLPNPDDVLFDEDATLTSLLTPGATIPFSVSLADNETTYGTATSRYVGPLQLVTNPASASSIPTQAVYVHHYGPGFDPTMSSEFTDPTQSHLSPDSGMDRNLVIKAGTNGNQIFLLATWDDDTMDTRPGEWHWNGLTWTRSGGQDSLRVMLGRDSTFSSFNAQGCAVACHSTPSGLTLSGDSDFADIWSWEAGKGALVNQADDLSIHPLRGVQTSGLVPDAGLSAFQENLHSAGSHPEFMATTDPNANASVLTLGVPGAADAIPFLDAAAGLPSNGGGPVGVSYSQDIQPIFQARCSSCHPGFASLNLQTHAGLIAGGVSGPAIIPGDPSSSLLIARITGTITPQMPLGQTPLTSFQIGLITTWIQEGAQNN